MVHPKHTSLLAALLLIAAGHSQGSALPTHGKKVTDLLVLGDSYSDNCNRWRLFNASPEQKEQYPFPFCPPAPTGRASGGESWPELLRIEQGQTIQNEPYATPQPLAPGQWNVTNVAVSGATCDNNVFPANPVTILDVGQQLGTFKTANGAIAPVPRLPTSPKTSVAAVFIGTNDVGFYDDVDLDDPVAAEGDCIRRRLTQLHDFGYRRMLLLENINLENVPLYSVGAVPNATIQAFVTGNNKLQASIVRELNKKWKHDGTKIEIFPTYELFKRMYNNPTAYGLQNTASSCVVGNTTCDDRDQYLWYDSLHPGEKAERVLARKVIRFLEDGARGEKLLAGPN